MEIGKRKTRVDGVEKASGRARYTADFLNETALVARLVTSTIANGTVSKIDASHAASLPGVVKVFSCFDVQNNLYSVAGKPYVLGSTYDPAIEIPLLSTRVRYYGEPVAVVVAQNEVIAAKAAACVVVEYCQEEPVFDPVKAIQPGASLLHPTHENNILARSASQVGEYEAATSEDGLLCVQSTYSTQEVQHCHMETAVSYAYQEGEKITVVTSTQIPHIVRRLVASALNLRWGMVRIVKPYIGGGFGNKQDALFEPLNAYLCTQLGGRLVKLELSREEVFQTTRTRHASQWKLTSHVRADGTLVARDMEMYSDSGAYNSHSNGVFSKGIMAYQQLYRTEKASRVNAYCVFTNHPMAGAMRGYGAPQGVFAAEAHADDIAQALGMDPAEFRLKNCMDEHFVDPLCQCNNKKDALRRCVKKAIEATDWDKKRQQYKNQTGRFRRGIGMALSWYNTGVWPFGIETSSCRMLLNQDGSIQLQLGESEIGQGADTVFTQIAADAIGVLAEDIHIVSTQDTELTPYGSGAYASRQTYVGNAAIQNCAKIFKEKVLNAAAHLLHREPESLQLQEGYFVDAGSAERLLSLAQMSLQTLYDTKTSQHIAAEHTTQLHSNALALGCSVAEVEVDTKLCAVRVLALTNVHDAGRIVNPALAEAQVHGGMSMALGYALHEKLLFDKDTGRMLNGNFLDYKIPTSMDHPPVMQALFLEDDTEPSKALGEPPSIPVAPAIRNAVLQATGVSFSHLPLSPETLFRGLYPQK